MDACGAYSSSSSSSLEKYDVFLSFRGEDTRNSFTSHLYAALDRKKIKTYIDEKTLERGNEISPTLLEAIRKSKISIIVFSKDYASSSWCLRELVHILECHREDKGMVIPIFYEVDPSHIRKQEGSYGEAFNKHEQRFKDGIDTVQKWKDALKESADLSGWDSRVTRPESKLVEAIVEDVLKKLNREPLSNCGFEGLIGIDKQIEEIKSLLSLRSEKVRIVGIWGMGGIGKTTLAEVMFYKLSSQFEARCFVPNVKEQSEKQSLISMRNKLLAELLEEKHINVGTPSLGPAFVKERLQRTKVLIVLDDVNHEEQFKSFVGDRGCFREESIIVVTTRDRTVLEKIAADVKYEVKLLDFDEARHLFNLNIASRGDSPITYYIDLSEEVVRYAGGIPLAITVLASHFRSLRSQSKKAWKMALDELKVVPHDDIHQKLRISYDGLDNWKKDIFLDIACFFKGMSRDYVENILNACGFYANNGIDVLINKSLVTIKDQRLWMHDLLQEMGQRVVCEKSTELRKRSRLWIAEDARQVLENNEGTSKIEGIFLDLSKIDEEIQLEPTIFRKMHNLRLLKIYGSSKSNKGKVDLQHLQHLPRSLRYLEWHGYPLKSLPSNFKANNLVVLKLPFSQLEQLWNGAQDLTKLRDIHLGHSKNLTQIIPDLYRAPNLERLNLSYCNKLQSGLHRIFDVASVRTLTLQGLSNLNTLPMTISRSLVSLDLSSTGIMSLPSSIDSLYNLSKLSLNDCTRLENLPTSINKLGSLIELELVGCSILQTFPELPMNIETLFIHGAAIKEVASSSIEGRFHLSEISLEGCRSLERLPTSIFKLSSLHWLSLVGCSNLKNLPGIPETLKSLESLHLSGTGIRELPSSIGHLIGLTELNVADCKNLESIPSTICNLERLLTLMLFNCPKVEYFPSLNGPCHWRLYSLDLSDSNITEIPESIKNLSRLKELDVKNCMNLCSLPELPLSLECLDASGCMSLKKVFNSKRALTQEFKDYEDIEWESTEYSLFSDCLKLDQNEVHSIIIEFFCKLFRGITHLIREGYQDFLLPVGVCFPGNNIPAGFKLQSEGSCIEFKLPPHRHNSNFLGFVLCAVGESYSDNHFIRLSCQINLKPNHKFKSEFIDGIIELPKISNSGNVYMWYYWLRDYDECHDAVEASLRFSFKDWVRLDKQVTSKCEVKKCGIRMLYRTDLEKFGFHVPNDQHLLEESNWNIDSYLDSDSGESNSAAIPDHSESNTTCGFINLDTEEPHPKRIKFTDFEFLRPK